jgi:ankyrin repeat protein
MMAASSGELNAMTMLLTRKAGPADINAYANDDGTALTLAIARGQVEAVKHLLKYRADANLTGPGLEPPLALAASTGNKEFVKLIMDAGGYQNTQSRTYGSALAAAASSSNLELVQTIIPIDHSIQSCQHALEQAAAVVSKETVDFLLKNVRGLQCDVAFTKAASKGANDILQMLWAYSHLAKEQERQPVHGHRLRAPGDGRASLIYACGS